jgi:hypothetical protein
VLADFDMAVAANGDGIGGNGWFPFAVISVFVVAPLIAALPEIIHWWRDSRTVFRLCWHVRRILSPLRLLRKRPTKPTAGAGAPTPAPAVSHPEDTP